MGDPSSSSNSRSANVAKILIDLDEYKKLLDLKQHFETQDTVGDRYMAFGFNNVIFIGPLFV